MALTLEQEKALLALLDEKRTTLPELTAATEIYDGDLFLANQMLADKSVTAEVVKRFVSPDATLDKRGIVQLTNDANSDSETKAVTPKGVKTALGNYLPLSGGALEGLLSVPYMFIKKDKYWPSIKYLNEQFRDYGGLELNDYGDLYLYVKNDQDTMTGVAKLKSDGYFEIWRNTNILPVGAPIPWPMPVPPSGWLKCNGAEFDKTAYPELAKVYPSGVLPDLRGEFIRGWDDGRGIDGERLILSFQEWANGKHSHSINTGGNLRYTNGSGSSLDFHLNGNLYTLTTEETGENESRPRNVAFLYIVRAA